MRFLPSQRRQLLVFVFVFVFVNCERQTGAAQVADCSSREQQQQQRDLFRPNTHNVVRLWKKTKDVCPTDGQTVGRTRRADEQDDTCKLCVCATQLALSAAAAAANINWPPAACTKLGDSLLVPFINLNLLVKSLCARLVSLRSSLSLSLSLVAAKQLHPLD